MIEAEDPRLNNDQNAVAKLCKALIDANAIKARTGRHSGWVGYNSWRWSLGWIVR